MATQFSNSKPLTVLQVPPDDQAGWRFVLADLTNTTVLVNDWQVNRGEWQQLANGVGSGSVFVPKGDPAIAEVLSNDPTARKAGLVRAYLDDRFRYAFFAEDKADKITDDAGQLVRFHGLGMESIAAGMLVRPPGHPDQTQSQAWQYGSLANLVRNADLSEDSGIVNDHGQDGNDADGQLLSWTTRGDVNYAKSVFSPGAAYGLYEELIEVDPDSYHSGIEQSISCSPNKVYHVRAYVKELTGAGQRITLALGGATDISATGTYANNFVYGNEVMAELDNVASTGTGCPGGASDGTWQVLDVEVKTGKDQTSLSIAIQNDHHDGCANQGFDPFYIGEVTVEGFGVNLVDWEAFDEAAHASNSWQRVTSPVPPGGLYGAKLNPLERFAGMQQTGIGVTPGETYRVSVQHYIGSVISGDTVKLSVWPTGGDTELAFQSTVLVAGSWQTTKMEVTIPDDVDEVLFRFVYNGANNPAPITVASPAILPGWDPASAGQILLDLLAPIQARGTFDYLQLNFDGSLDSAGQPWQSLLSLDVYTGSSILDVLQRMDALGYDWQIAPVDYASGNDSGFELSVWNKRSIDPSSGIGTDWTADPNGPVVVPGDGILEGTPRAQTRRPNVVYVQGANGAWSEVQQEPFDAVTYPEGYEATIGRIEAHLTVSDSSDPAVLNKYGAAFLADEKAREDSFKLRFTRSAWFRPYRDFGVGDRLHVDFPPDHPDPSRSSPRSVRGISVRAFGEGTDVTYNVDFDRVVLEDDAAVLAAVAQLLERSPTEISGAGAGRVSASGTASSSLVVSGGTVTSGSGSHSHAMSELTGKALTGDVTGQVDGTIRVIRLQGIPVSEVVPGNDGTHVLLQYDYTDKTWRPTKLVGLPLGGATDEVLTKLSGTDYDTAWAPVPRTVEALDDVWYLPSAPTAGQVLAWAEAGYVAYPKGQYGDITIKFGSAFSTVPGNIVDSNDSTEWISTSGSEPWIRWDMGASVAVSRFRIRSGGGFALNLNSATLQGSNNDVDWTTVVANVTSPGYSNNTTYLHDFTEVSYRYWRVIRFGWSGSYYGMAEVDLMLYAGPGWFPGDAGAASPLTTKGDVYTYDTADARLGVGTDGQVLTADSAEATGLKWADAPSGSPTTTQGDLIRRGASADERLPIGSADQVLTVVGGVPAWADASGGGGGGGTGAGSSTAAKIIAYGQASFTATGSGTVVTTVDLASYGITQNSEDLEVVVRVHERQDGDNAAAPADIWQVSDAWFMEDAAGGATTPPDDLRIRCTKVSGGTSGYTVYLDWAILATVPIDTGLGTRVLIEEQVVSSSVANVDFTNIPSVYTDLVIEMDLVTADAADQDRPFITVGNGSLDSGSNYSYYIEYNGTTSSTNSSASDTKFMGAVTLRGAGEAAAPSGLSLFTIRRYADTSVWKEAEIWGAKGGDSYYWARGAGTWRSTAAIDTIRVAAEGGNITGGTIRLYGIATDESGGNGSLVPVWVQHLVDRTVDGESVHVDDDEFTAASLTGWTNITNGAGTRLWTPKRGRLSVQMSGIAASDYEGQVKAMSPSSAPVTIETACVIYNSDVNFSMMGLAFTDGTTTAANLIAAELNLSSGGAGFECRDGTWAAMNGAGLSRAEFNDDAVPMGMVYLQLIWVSANTFKVRLSVDGISWKDLGTDAKTMTPTHYGVFATNWGGGANDMHGAFEYFRVTEADLSA